MLPAGFSMIRHGFAARSSGAMSTMMPDHQIAALQLQFARQLYDRCLERHGRDHEQTRLVLDYISVLESRNASTKVTEKRCA